MKAFIEVVSMKDSMKSYVSSCSLLGGKHDYNNIAHSHQRTCSCSAHRLMKCCLRGYMFGRQKAPPTLTIDKRNGQSRYLAFVFHRPQCWDKPDQILGSFWIDVLKRKTSCCCLRQLVSSCCGRARPTGGSMRRMETHPGMTWGELFKLLVHQMGQECCLLAATHKIVGWPGVEEQYWVGESSRLCHNFWRLKIRLTDLHPGSCRKLLTARLARTVVGAHSHICFWPRNAEENAILKEQRYPNEWLQHMEDMKNLARGRDTTSDAGE